VKKLLFVSVILALACGWATLVAAAGQWHYHVAYQDQYRVGIVFQHPENISPDSLELCRREFARFQDFCMNYQGMSAGFTNGLEKSPPHFLAVIYPELKLGPDGKFNYEISRASLEFFADGKRVKSIPLEMTHVAKNHFYNLVAYNLNLVMRNH